MQAEVFLLLCATASIPSVSTLHLQQLQTNPVLGGYTSVRDHRNATLIDWGQGGRMKNKNAIIRNYVIGPSLKTYISSIIDKDCV